MTEVTLGGIVSGFNGGYVFKIQGNRDTLRSLKTAFKSLLQQQGYDVIIERGYHDRR